MPASRRASRSMTKTSCRASRSSRRRTTDCCRATAGRTCRRSRTSRTRSSRNGTSQGETTMRKTLIVTAALLLAVPLFAQSLNTAARRGTTMDSFASDFHTIPVMGNVAGVGGARFQTRVSLLNPTANAFDVQATLYDNNGTPQNAVLHLAPGQVTTFQNFLGDVFNGYTG